METKLGWRATTRELVLRPTGLLHQTHKEPGRAVDDQATPVQSTQAYPSHALSCRDPLKSVVRCVTVVLLLSATVTQRMTDFNTMGSEEEPPVCTQLGRCTGKARPRGSATTDQHYDPPVHKPADGSARPPLPGQHYIQVRVTLSRTTHSVPHAKHNQVNIHTNISSLSTSYRARVGHVHRRRAPHACVARMQTLYLSRIQYPSRTPRWLQTRIPPAAQQTPKSGLHLRLRAGAPRNVTRLLRNSTSIAVNKPFCGVATGTVFLPSTTSRLSRFSLRTAFPRCPLPYTGPGR